MSTIRLLPAIALLSAGPLAAQEKNIENSVAERPLEAEEVAAAVRYALPHLYSGVRTRCSSVLATDGFLATNGDRLMEKFSDGADENWAEARALVVDMVSEDEEDGTAEAIASMPDAGLKPFVDAMIPTVIASEIKDEDCADAERIFEVLDPLPAENFSELIGIIVALAERDDSDEREAEEQQASAE